MTTDLRTDDPFLLQYQPSDLRIASEFLTTWLPFLTRDLCSNCTQLLSNRIRSLDSTEVGGVEADKTETCASPSIVDSHENCCDDNNCENNSTASLGDGDETNSLGSWKDGANGWSEQQPPVSEAASTSGILGPPPSSVDTSSHRMSWADMAQEDELEEEEEQRDSDKRTVNISASTGEMKISKVVEKPKLSREQREYIRFTSVKRKKEFICFERVKGKLVNIVQGLELHTGVFSAVEQTRIVNYVYELQEMGRKGELKGWLLFQDVFFPLFFLFMIAVVFNYCVWCIYSYVYDILCCSWTS